MEQMNHRNISGNQAISAGSEENGERTTDPVVGVEESPQKRARTSSENLGAQQTGPVTFNGPSQGLLMQNALPEVGKTSTSVCQLEESQNRLMQ
jgi:hypothetical protein